MLADSDSTGDYFVSSAPPVVAVTIAHSRVATMTTVTMATALVDTALMMDMIGVIVMAAAMGVAVTMEVVIDMMMDE
jgi:hypothetical protein